MREMYLLCMPAAELPDRTCHPTLTSRLGCSACACLACCVYIQLCLHTVVDHHNLILDLLMYSGYHTAASNSVAHRGQHCTWPAHLHTSLPSLLEFIQERCGQQQLFLWGISQCDDRVGWLLCR